VLAGFVTDALADPALVEAQNRLGQITYGARVSAHQAWWQAAVALHEQRDAIGVAYRGVSGYARALLGERFALGGRLTFDTIAAAFSEARLFLDMAVPRLPSSIDYSYQNPVLLLPSTSVLAAFGGLPWHELGLESTFVALQSLKVSGRAAAQLYEGDPLGGRASLKVTWIPDLDRRGFALAEAGRALVPPSGFTFVRAGARWRLVPTVWVSGDASLYQYDLPIRGQTRSLTGIASLEWQPLPRLRAVISGTAMSTPYSVFETQALGKLVVDIGEP
jgi:hypothetical protein